MMERSFDDCIHVFIHSPCTSLLYNVRGYFSYITYQPMTLCTTTVPVHTLITQWLPFHFYDP